MNDREAFEAIYRVIGIHPLDGRDHFELNGLGLYLYPSVQLAWQMWQAAINWERVAKSGGVKRHMDGIFAETQRAGHDRR